MAPFRMWPVWPISNLQRLENIEKHDNGLGQIQTFQFGGAQMQRERLNWGEKFVNSLHCGENKLVFRLI